MRFHMLRRREVAGRLFTFPMRKLERSRLCSVRFLSTTSSDNSPGNPVPPKAALFAGDDLWDPSWSMCAGEETIRRGMSPAKEPKLQFYSSWYCPNAQQTWIALEESKVYYQWNEINPNKVFPNVPGGYSKREHPFDDKRKLYPEFCKASPLGIVPALSHITSDGVTKRGVWESLPTCDYVNTVFGSGSLIPEDPYERAMVQIWSSHCINAIHFSHEVALNTKNPWKRMGHLGRFYSSCRLLADAMATKGPFFLGSRFSMLDVILAPIWQRVLWIGGHYMQVRFPKHMTRHFNRLQMWWEATSKRPSVACTMVCQDRLIAFHSDYAYSYKGPIPDSSMPTTAKKGTEEERSTNTGALTIMVTNNNIVRDNVSQEETLEYLSDRT